MAKVLFKKGDELYQEVFERKLKPYLLTSFIDVDSEEVLAQDLRMAFKKSHLKNQRFLGAKVEELSCNRTLAFIVDKGQVIGHICEMTEGVDDETST